MNGLDLVAVPDAFLARLARQHVGSVPARVEMAWPIENNRRGTKALIHDGRRRLADLADAHSFMVVADAWDFEGCSVLSVVAKVLYWPTGPVERLLLEDPVEGELVEEMPSIGGVPFPAVVAPVARHGTHAAFNRHKKAGEDPCPACVAGESAYQRARSTVVAA